MADGDTWEDLPAEEIEVHKLNLTKPPHTISSVYNELYQPSKEAQTLVGEVERKLKAEDVEWDNAIIQPLKDLALEKVALNYEKHPELTAALRSCDQETVLDRIPVDIPLELAIQTIPDGHFWKRVAKSRWSEESFPRPHTICNVADYSGSWMRLVLERHFQEYLESVDPEVTEPSEVQALTELVSEYIRRVDIREMVRHVPFYLPDNVAEEDPPDPGYSDHFPLDEILPMLKHLEEFHIVFTKRYMEDKFDWHELRVSIKDCHLIGVGLAKVPTLQVLHVHKSRVEDYRLTALLRPLVEVRHPGLVHLNFSNCLIGDEGALALAATMLELPNLRILTLTNNKIGPRGAKGLAYAIAVQTSPDAAILIRSASEDNVEVSELPEDPIPSPMYFNGKQTLGSSFKSQQAREYTNSLEELELRLNPIGDLGGMFIAAALSRGGGPKMIDLAACNLENMAGLHIAEALRFTTSVQGIDLSCNPLSEASGKAFLEALEENAVLLQIDLRETLVSQEDIEKIKEALALNWQDRRNLWEQQKLQDKKMAMEARSGGSTLERESQDMPSAKLTESRLTSVATEALMENYHGVIGMASEVSEAFEKLDSGGEEPRQICEKDPELIDDDEIYCRNALDNIVPLVDTQLYCKLPQEESSDEEEDENEEGEDEGGFKEGKVKEKAKAGGGDGAILKADPSLPMYGSILELKAKDSLQERPSVSGLATSSPRGVSKGKKAHGRTRPVTDEHKGSSPKGASGTKGKVKARKGAITASEAKLKKVQDQK